MAARSALQSVRELEMLESAALDPRLQVAVDPMVVYGINQQFVFGNLLPKAWADNAFVQLARAGVANDRQSLENAANEAGLRLTDEEATRVESLRTMLEANSKKGPGAMEEIALEDGIGIPAIAILVLVIIIIIALWVQIF